MRKHRRLLWFLFGLGSQFQLFGTSLCFSELFVYGAAIFLASSEMPHLRRNGIMPFFWVSILLLCNGALSGVVNHTPFAGMLRGMAVLCLIPCTIIVGHWMLRRDMANFKWMIVGSMLSGFLSTFMFQNAFQLQGTGEMGGSSAAAEAIMSGPLWMVGRVGDLAMLFPKGWYLQCPTIFSAALPVGLAAFALLTSVSGRGTSVRSLCTALLVLLGGKKPSTIRRRVCRQFILLCVLGVMAVGGFKTLYQHAALAGWLGEKALQKYETQTKGDKSVMALLLGGRMESFCGLIACVDRPIIGFGPWAIDTGGYTGKFLEKYGKPEDFEAYSRARQKSSGVGLIPCHAYLSEFWCWYGIMGLVFWLYVIFLMLRYLKQDCYAVPQWYFWLAAGVPAYLWDIFFNPFAARIGAIMFVVAILMVRAVRRGRLSLPIEMQKEIWEIERK